MKLADQIRAHVIECHFHPARAKGATQIELRAGDIHHEMKLVGRMPAICSAMGGARLLTEADVQLGSRCGPKEGANVWFTYLLQSGVVLPPPPRSRPAQPRAKFAGQGSARPPEVPPDSPPPDFSGALVLVSCAKAKQSTAAKACDLYTSTAFKLAKHLAERHNADWRILSAKHGLLHPDECVEPYDLTLNAMPIRDRRAWADRVLEALLPLAREHGRVILLAGQRYREPLEPALMSAGIECKAPMAHLRQGEQLAWLLRQTEFAHNSAG